jgi:alanine-alpha-ketoisovalerate/valine-pyruvate aminotransferase
MMFELSELIHFSRSFSVLALMNTLSDGVRNSNGKMLCAGSVGSNSTCVVPNSSKLVNSLCSKLIRSNRKHHQYRDTVHKIDR